MEAFLEERQASLKWLNSLTSANWEASYQAPWGPIRAGDLLAAWVGHDLLHMRQMVELHRAYILKLAEPYQMDYAGAW